MEDMDDRIADRIAIQELKASYFRFLDTKQWDQWRQLFTDDLVFTNDDSALPTDAAPMVTGGDAFVAMVSSSLANSVTVHQGHMPEITFVGADEARGIWAMFDWVHDRDSESSMQGFGHYHERYLRGDDGRWRIADLRLTRLRVDTVAATAPGGERPWPSPWQPPAA